MQLLHPYEWYRIAIDQLATFWAWRRRRARESLCRTSHGALHWGSTVGAEFGIDWECLSAYRAICHDYFLYVLAIDLTQPMLLWYTNHVNPLNPFPKSGDHMLERRT